jgi:hypothetical protein
MIALFSAALVGCETAAPTTRSYSLLRLPEVSRAEAFDAAVLAMSERFHIEEADREAGIIRSVPQESESDTAGRAGDVVGMPRRVRTIATTHVSGNEQSSEVWCKVVVERSETSETLALSRELSADDAPTETPSQRDAAGTPEQNEVWRATGRDRRTERAVLAAIQELSGQRRRGGDGDIVE